jgi:hypothetical protein
LLLQPEWTVHHGRQALRLRLALGNQTDMSLVLEDGATFVVAGPGHGQGQDQGWLLIALAADLQEDRSVAQGRR